MAVMMAMMRRPPEWTALDRAGAEQRENELPQP
jgi:hypothetical protein